MKDRLRDAKEERREYQKMYRETHRESLQEYHKKRYDKVVKHNPEIMAKRAAYHAEWQRQNKDKLNAYQRERRRKKKAERSENGT